MCGIFGGWFLERKATNENNIIKTMRALQHRGPNDRGYEWHSENILLGHTRLSILDLSSAGHQPMHSSDGRYVIVYNGEIYNYKELRAELRQLGCQFHTQTDTEVLLVAWQVWGLSCLGRLLGMFAFVIYDKQAKTLTCVRDAFGIKPFFYSTNARYFLFASEQPALLALRDEEIRADWQRSYDYLVYADYDSQERTFIEGISHLMPGHFVQFNVETGNMSKPTVWWVPKTHQRTELTFNQASETLREQFLTNIRLHLRSDVALGAALSGGIDSSAVVCAMRYIEPDLPIHTFSFIADDKQISEEYWVDRVNQHVGAIPYKIKADPYTLARDLDGMILAQGEPFGSTSIYAQYCLFKRVREENVTVTLDGQGADELLAGYYGYPGERILSLLEQKQWLRILQFVTKWGRWPNRTYKQAFMHLGRIILPDHVYQQAGKWIGRDAAPSWINVSMLKDAGLKMQDERMVRNNSFKGRRVIERLAFSLQYRGLPGLLRHGDRNAMRFSVESRVPFLTLPMADLLLSLPEEYLISQSGETKHIFRAAMRGIVPNDVLDRRDKIGFSTPEKNWLISIAPTIRQWLQTSADVPFLNRDALLIEFERVMTGRAPFSWQVWRWINFVRWYEVMILRF